MYIQTQTTRTSHTHTHTRTPINVPIMTMEEMDVVPESASSREGNSDMSGARHQRRTERKDKTRAHNNDRRWYASFHSVLLTYIHVLQSSPLKPTPSDADADAAAVDELWGWVTPGRVLVALGLGAVAVLNLYLQKKRHELKAAEAEQKKKATAAAASPSGGNADEGGALTSSLHSFIYSSLFSFLESAAEPEFDEDVLLTVAEDVDVHRFVRQNLPEEVQDNFLGFSLSYLTSICAYVSLSAFACTCISFLSHCYHLSMPCICKRAINVSHSIRVFFSASLSISPCLSFACIV